ncbi:protein of unknown function [Ralstonia solanacearum CFBP2957]|nr:protein of unknown function [Ralstonia solanacearum CFBP2957]
MACEKASPKRPQVRGEVWEHYKRCSTPRLKLREKNRVYARFLESAHELRLLKRAP